MLTQIYDNYGNIYSQDLSENDARLKSIYNVSQPIESFFDQVEYVMELLDAGNAAYTLGKISNIAFKIIFNT